MESVHKKCTPSMKVLHKNVLPPFPITRFLRLASSAICDTIWRETLVVGKFGQLSAKLPLQIIFGKLLYRVHPMQLSFEV